jgi:3-oxoadipate enol-lactonase
MRDSLSQEDGLKVDEPPVVLLLHPIGQDATCWRWLKLEGVGVRLVAPDLPGHGSCPRRATSLRKFADEAVSAVAGTFDLVGVAMGGMVAQHVLLQCPTRVRSAVLICTHGSSDRKVCEERARAAERWGMGPVVASTLKRWFTPEALGQPQHPGVAYARERLLAMDHHAYADAWRAMGDHQVLDALGTVGCPVTVVAGSRDASVPLVELERLHRRIPGSRLEVIDAPHMAHLERPELVTAAIVRHLAWVAESKSGGL